MDKAENKKRHAPQKECVDGSTVAVLANRLQTKLGELGLLGTLKLIPKNLRRLAQVYVDERYDRRHGVKTAGYTHLHELVIESPNKGMGIRYQPTTHKRMAAMFANLPQNLSEFTFVDFGSGRGRVLLFASGKKFKRVIGVEFSEELHLSAVENLARANHVRLCPDVQSIHADATKFQVPEGPLVLYFFDPFRDDVMQKVLSNIRQAYLSRPRKIFLMYLAPVHEAMVLDTEVFHRVTTPKLPHEYSLPAQYAFSMFETSAGA